MRLFQGVSAPSRLRFCPRARLRARVLLPCFRPRDRGTTFERSLGYVHVRLRARGCSLFFEGFEASTPGVGSPRSLKPWVAAGGREAI